MNCHYSELVSGERVKILLAALELRSKSLINF